MLTLLGILGGLIFIIGDFPYIDDIFKSKTKPHRVSWLIFFILDLIFLINQYALHATNSLWLIYAWTSIAFLIFILSIKKGVGGFAKLDVLCLIGALIGLLFWALLKTPLISLYCNLIVSAIAFVPTIKKSYLDPSSETKISWFTAALAAVLATVSVGKLNYQLLALPILSFTATITIFGILVYKDSVRYN